MLPWPRHRAGAQGDSDQRGDGGERGREGEWGHLVAGPRREPANGLAPQIPRANRSEEIDNREDDQAPPAHPGIRTPVGEDQLGQQNGQEDGPATLVPELEEQVDPVDTERSPIDVLWIGGDEEGSQSGLQDQALLYDCEGDAQEQDGVPASASVAHEGPNEQRSAAVDADLWQQEVEHRDVCGSEEELNDDGREHEQGEGRGYSLSCWE